MLKGFTRNFGPLEILTEEQVEAINRGTLDVLWETGIRIESERGLKFLAKNDCKVDYDEKRVRFPQGLVEECLRKCPSSWRFKARDPKNDVVLGGNSVYFTNLPGTKTIDIDTWEPRIATRKENYDGLTVLDSLDNLHILSNYTPYFGFEGVPPAMAIAESCAGKFRYSTKAICEGFSMGSEIFTIEMAKALGTDILQLGGVAAPPLTYYENAIECIFRFVEAELPIIIGSGAVMGGTGPVTIAGATITNNAELMAGVVLTQLIKPASRVGVFDFCFPLDMRGGSPAFGGIEISLHQMVFNQIWRKYGIVTLDAAGGLSSSKRIDFQSGYEKSINSLTAGLSGANIILLQGGPSSELTFHPLQAILDDDVAGMIGHCIEGVEVSDETLAIDLIEKVGPIPGFYIDKEHTRKWWKKEQFEPKATDRLTYPEWMEGGKKSCLDYAKQMMEEMLATHKVSIPLTASQEEDIEKILKKARRYYRGKSLISDEEWAAYRKDLTSRNYPYG